MAGAKRKNLHYSGYFDNGATNYSSQGGSSWMVMANSKNPDVAMDFLNKTSTGSVELYDTILPTSGAIATWAPATDAPNYKKGNDFFGGQIIFADFVEYSTHVPRIKYGVYNYEAREQVGVAVSNILEKGMSLEAALKGAQEQVEFLLWRSKNTRRRTLQGPGGPRTADLSFPPALWYSGAVRKRQLP